MNGSASWLTATTSARDQIDLQPTAAGEDTVDLAQPIHDAAVRRHLAAPFTTGWVDHLRTALQRTTNPRPAVRLAPLEQPRPPDRNRSILDTPRVPEDTAPRRAARLEPWTPMDAPLTSGCETPPGL